MLSQHPPPTAVFAAVLRSNIVAGRFPRPVGGIHPKALPALFHVASLFHAKPVASSCGFRAAVGSDQAEATRFLIMGGSPSPAICAGSWAASVPACPAPLAPIGLSFVGHGLLSTLIMPRSAARGIA